MTFLHASVALTFAGATLLLTSVAASQETDTRGSADVVLRALEDEMTRSMTLKLEDLDSPYFVQYRVTDRRTQRVSATAGAIVSSSEGRSRRLSADVRVGYYDLDNTNFAGGGGRGGLRRTGRRGRPRGGGGGGGGMVALPLDDDYRAIRHQAWIASDGVYKRAVEALARKKAYLEERPDEDRPDDFARTEKTIHIEPLVDLELDVAAWERVLRRVSERFLAYPHVLDSSVRLDVTADNKYLLNSEGTRVRRAETAVTLLVVAEALAGDGHRLEERLTRRGMLAGDLPSEDELIEEVDAMALRLAGRRAAPVIEQYLGPVLFAEKASPQLFQSMLARGVTGRASSVGGGRRRFAGAESLDKYLQRRILPRGFHVFDDPRIATLGDVPLSGHYAIDDDGVPAQRVEIVIDGRLEMMLMSRAPTDDFSDSNGHGRGGAVATRASIGCLFVESSRSVDEGKLSEALMEAAADQGLDFALRIESLLDSGGGFAGGFPGGGFPGGTAGGTLGDPTSIYRVYPDGREELVRGCEFATFDVGMLKDIIAIGDRSIVHNLTMGGVASSIISPAVLIEEVELFEIESEGERHPIIDAPHQR